MVLQPEQQQILAATTGLACACLPNSGFLRDPGATCSLLHSCQKVLFFCLVVERLQWVPQLQDAWEAGASSSEMTGVCVGWMTEIAEKMGGI